LAIALFISPTIAPSANAALGRIIHKERSLYRTILVAKDGRRLCMQFSVRSDQRNQSCKDTKEPQRLVFEYAKLVFAGMLMQPQPRSILIVGLGGGTLPDAFRSLLPDARIDVVEIDAAVVKVAEQFFDYQISEPGELFVQDARIFGKRAARAQRSYDMILLDAFNGDYIPEHLMTREYLLETQKLLNPGGVLLANTFSISELYHHESATYASVFGAFYTVATPSSANRVIVAIKGEQPSIGTITRNQQRWQSALEPLGVDLARIQRLLDSTPDWNIEARVLTDQYAPANLLQR
jgi:spermidine synthase